MWALVPLATAALFYELIVFAPNAQARPANFSVSSTTFSSNAIVADRMVNNAAGCRGKNMSPELHWRGAPSGTKSFALTAWDPDAPAPGGWWHWVLYDISPRRHQIAEGRSAGTSGITSFGASGYGGPCPPPGPLHHYRFTIYALNVAHLRGAPSMTAPQLIGAMRGHVLAQGVLVGLYKR